MYASACELVKNDLVSEFAVASVYAGTTLKLYVFDGIKYFLIPRDHSIKHTLGHWRNVYKEFNPDIVHIHGTENRYPYDFLVACPEAKVVVSIQGLVSVCANYYYAGIKKMDLLRSITIRDIVRNDNLFKRRCRMLKQGKLERFIIQKAGHVIGRTNWDKAHCLSIDPNIVYYSCNETLRPEFYNAKWKYENCIKHSIFISQGVYPIKGVHKVLEALRIVKNKFQDVRLYVGGLDITKYETYKEKLKLTGYGKYLNKLINKYDLKDTVCFIGELDAKAMVECYLKSNLFICPSVIENSPNSLGEAQLLEVPFLATFVGGIPDMVSNSELLYRFEESEMLALKICAIFDKGADIFNAQDANNAEIRHDRMKNTMQLIEIYRQRIEIYNNR